MSVPMMQIKPEEIDTPEKRGKYTASIIGCGQMGILHAILFAKAGFKTVCVDTDQAVIGNITKGKATFLRSEDEDELKSHVKNGNICATNDMKKAASQSDVILVATPVKIDAKERADYRSIMENCRQIGLTLRRGSLVIIMNLTGMNITQVTIKDTLENTAGLKAGSDFGLAYSPNMTTREQTLDTISQGRRIVTATDKNSLIAASTLLESITNSGITKTENVSAAELAVLVEALRRDVNSALINELALFCEKVAIDYFEVQKLVDANKDNSLPSPMLSDAQTQRGSHLLLEDAESLNLKLRIPKIAREINERIVKHVANLTNDALRSCGKTFRRARISLLGISQNRNAKSIPKRAAREIVKILEDKGAKVGLYDPFFSKNELSEMRVHLARNLTEAIEGSDCIIILTGHDQFKRLNLNRLKVAMKMPAAIVDLDGTVEPEKVEKAGFIYRGLGRGVWTR
jgi:nucleotide sugar dehydrogenase